MLRQLLSVVENSSHPPQRPPGCTKRRQMRAFLPVAIMRILLLNITCNIAIITFFNINANITQFQVQFYYSLRLVNFVIVVYLFY